MSAFRDPFLCAVLSSLVRPCHGFTLLGLSELSTYLAIGGAALLIIVIAILTVCCCRGLCCFKRTDPEVKEMIEMETRQAQQADGGWEQRNGLYNNPLADKIKRGETDVNQSPATAAGPPTVGGLSEATLQRMREASRQEAPVQAAPPSRPAPFASRALPAPPADTATAQDKRPVLQAARPVVQQTNNWTGGLDRPGPGHTQPSVVAPPEPARPSKGRPAEPARPARGQLPAGRQPAVLSGHTQKTKPINPFFDDEYEKPAAVLAPTNPQQSRQQQQQHQRQVLLQQQQHQQQQRMRQQQQPQRLPQSQHRPMQQRMPGQHQRHPQPLQQQRMQQQAVPPRASNAPAVSRSQKRIPDDIRQRLILEGVPVVDASTESRSLRGVTRQVSSTDGMEGWSEFEVAQWIDGLGLLPAVRQALDGLSGADLAALTKRDLEDLGVAQVGQRMKILRARDVLQKPKAKRPSQSSSSIKANSLYRRQIVLDKGLLAVLREANVHHYAPLFQQEGIEDLTTLAQYDANELRQIGLKGGHAKRLVAIVHKEDEVNKQAAQVLSAELDKEAEVTAATAWSEELKLAKKQLAVTQPNGRPWTVDVTNVEVGDLLGYGAFGEVHYGKVKNLEAADKVTEVAIKTLKSDGDESAIIDFLAEVKFMQEIGQHPNVVNILGVQIDNVPMMIIVEYMRDGNLLDLLQDLRTKDSRSVDDAKELMQYCVDVASGMAFISSKRCVHRDLAARNILIHRPQAKIGDFGLARYVDDEEYTYMVQTTKRKLPTKWLAPECMLEGAFGTPSDVWAFGVILWEIVTLGGNPYRGIAARELFLMLTEEQYRMPRPVTCSKKLYELVNTCWHQEPSFRPSFEFLRDSLVDYVPDAGEHILIASEVNDVAEDDYEYQTMNYAGNVASSSENNSNNSSQKGSAQNDLPSYVNLEFPNNKPAAATSTDTDGAPDGLVFGDASSDEEEGHAGATPTSALGPDGKPYMFFVPKNIPVDTIEGSSSDPAPVTEAETIPSVSESIALATANPGSDGEGGEPYDFFIPKNIPAADVSLEQDNVDSVDKDGKPYIFLTPKGIPADAEGAQEDSTDTDQAPAIVYGFSAAVPPVPDELPPPKRPSAPVVAADLASQANDRVELDSDDEPFDLMDPVPQVNNDAVDLDSDGEPFDLMDPVPLPSALVTETVAEALPIVLPEEEDDVASDGEVYDKMDPVPVAPASVDFVPEQEVYMVVEDSNPVSPVHAPSAVVSTPAPEAPATDGLVFEQEVYMVVDDSPKPKPSQALPEQEVYMVVDDSSSTTPKPAGLPAGLNYDPNEQYVEVQQEDDDGMYGTVRTERRAPPVVTAPISNVDIEDQDVEDQELPEIPQLPGASNKQAPTAIAEVSDGSPAYVNVPSRDSMNLSDIQSQFSVPAVVAPVEPAGVSSVQEQPSEDVPATPATTATPTSPNGYMNMMFPPDDAVRESEKAPTSPEGYMNMTFDTPVRDPALDNSQMSTSSDAPAQESNRDSAYLPMSFSPERPTESTTSTASASAAADDGPTEDYVDMKFANNPLKNTEEPPSNYLPMQQRRGSDPVALLEPFDEPADGAYEVIFQPEGALAPTRSILIEDEAPAGPYETLVNPNVPTEAEGQYSTVGS